MLLFVYVTTIRSNQKNELICEATLIAGLVGLCMDCLNIEYRVILPDYRYRHTMEVRMPFAMEVRKYACDIC